MTNFFTVLITAVVLSTLYLMGGASILNGDSPKFHIENKEIHLKHGKLHPHPHQDDKKDEDEDEDHLIYRYRWLGDDIVKNEDEFEGEVDEEYSDKGNKIRLPGGCELTENQYTELESFKKETKYIKECYCENGCVYCQMSKTLLNQKVY